VSDAHLTVIHLDSGLLRNTVSGEDGWYAVSSLPKGEYKVTARKGGFRTVARLGVHLGQGDAARLDFDLEIGGMQEFITIEGGIATINTEDASSGMRIDEETARRLPINGRTLQGLIEFAPGVLATPATLGEAGQFSVNGQRPNANYFVTDGVSSNFGVGAAGLPGQFSGGTLPAMTALGSLQGLAVAGEIREMQVKTSTFAPEFGRMPGAQILVNTSAGSSNLHAEVSHAFRHERLSARDYFAGRGGLAQAPLRLHDFHASVGGPAQRDKTFFFAAIEVLRLRQPSVWRVAAPSTMARDAAGSIGQSLLDVFPRPQREVSRLYGESTLQASWPGRVTARSFRIDRLSESTGAIFLRYHDAPSENSVGLVQENHSTFSTRSLTVGVTQGPSAIVNDVRFNFSQISVSSTWIPGLASEDTLSAVRSLFLRPPEPLPGRLYGLAVVGLGHEVWGGGSTSSQGQFQAVDTLAVASGHHQIRLGFDYLRLTPSRNEAITTALAQYGSLDDLIQRLPPRTMYGAAPGGASLIEIASAFAQDTWTAGQRLNLTYGLRWEYMPPPASRVGPSGFVPVVSSFPGTLVSGPVESSVVPPFHALPEWKTRFGRLAPRTALAYRLNRDGNWVLRAGIGVFYDLGFASAIDPLNSVPFNSWLAQLTGSAEPTSGTQHGFASDLRIPYSWQWNLTMEGRVPGAGVVSAAWVGSSGHKLLRREGYIPALSLSDPAVRGANAIDNGISPALILATNNGKSNYHAFQFHFQRKLASGLGGIASYTWSHSIDNGSWDSGSYLVGTGVSANPDRGPSNFDVRHSFSAGFNYDLPSRGLPQFAREWSLHGIARLRTGFPIDILVGENMFGFGFDNAPRPNVVQGAPMWIEDPGTPGGLRLNPAAFAAPDREWTGNLGRNAIRGAGLAQLDAAVERKFKLAHSSVLRVRLQAYNITNAATLGDPVRVLASPLFGQPVSMMNLMLGTGRPISGITPAFQPGGPRTFEVSLSWAF
jgi:hypothetical protein